VTAPCCSISSFLTTTTVCGVSGSGWVYLSDAARAALKSFSRAPWTWTRCAALRESGGGSFACGVHERRPDPCREVQIGDGKCVQARRRHGLPALPPDAYLLR